MRLRTLRARMPDGNRQTRTAWELFDACGIGPELFDSAREIDYN